MGRLFTVIRKEIKDNLRDRRTIMSALLFGPLFGPIMFVAIISLSLSRATGAADEALEIDILGADNAPNLIAYLQSQHTDIDYPDIAREQAIADVRSGEREVVIVIPDTFGEQWTEARPARVEIISDNSDSRAKRMERRARGMLDGYGNQVGQMRLVARGIDPSITRALSIDNIDTSTPSGRSALLLGMLSYFLIFSMLMGGMYLAIDSTAGERERGSLEPLLTLPVGRGTLLTGKLIATCFFMCCSLALALVGFAIALPLVPLQQLGMSVSFGFDDIPLAFAVIAPFALLGASLLTVVASFTKSFKEAQSYLTVAMLIPTLPLIVASVLNVRTSLPLMSVPSLSQHLMILDLIKGEALDPVLAGTSIVATLGYGVLLALVAIRLYKREGLLL